MADELGAEKQRRVEISLSIFLIFNKSRILILFIQCALNADLKLNQLLLEALDAREEKQRREKQNSRFLHNGMEALRQKVRGLRLDCGRGWRELQKTRIL